MRVQRVRVLRFLAVLVSAACVPSLSRAAQVQVQVTSSTQHLRYADFLSAHDDQQDVAEYLRLKVTLDGRDDVAVYGYGRALVQLTTSDEQRRELADDTVGRLYYLFLDYRDVVPKHLDLRAGRTFVGTAALPGLVDGAQLQGRNLGLPGLGATAFGGRRVFLDDKSELKSDSDSLWGASVSYDTLWRSRAELSYGREYREGDLARESTALDATTTPRANVNVFGRAKYDHAASRFSELIAGAKVAPLEALVLRGEYFSSAPTFDAFSFYRFFGVERYQQLSLAAEYRFGANLRVHAKYANEVFDGSESANLVGCGVFAHPLKGLFVNASYEKRSGFAGRLGGLRLNASYAIEKATVLAGVDYDDFRREASRSGDARKYWAGAGYELNKTFSAALRAERNENFLFEASYQGFVAVDVHL